jgi:hypothetical protein
MKSPETGHAKNMAGFAELVSSVVAFGTDYKPARASISTAELQKLLAEARTALVSLDAALPAYGNAVAAREVGLLPLSKLVTRVYNVLVSNTTSQQVDENARTLVRKINGRRAKAKLTEDAKSLLKADGIEKREISASQMSADNRIENLFKLIQLLNSIPEYAPNEEAFSVAGLTTLYNNLMSKNEDVVNAAILLRHARNKRNEVFYKPDTGICDISLAVKAYVKGLYGNTSVHYKHLTGLTIKYLKV